LLPSKRKPARFWAFAEFNSGVSEVYDVQALPGIRRAGMHGLVTDGRLRWHRYAANGALDGAQGQGKTLMCWMPPLPGIIFSAP